MCKKLLFLISFVVIFSLVGSTFADTIDVGAAFRNKTIDDGIKAASAGDTIIVHADHDGHTKHFRIDAALTKADDSKHDVTLKAYAGDHIIIDTGIHFSYKSGWTIDGLVVQNLNTSSSYGIVVYSRAGFANADGFTVKNTIITNVGSNAFYHYGRSGACYANNWTWENNTVYNATGHDGIRLNGYNYNWTVKDSIFQGVKHWDISVTDWGGSAIVANGGSAVYADYCTFYDNGKADVDGVNGYTASDQALYGTDVTTGTEVQFISTNIDSPMFLMLKTTNIDKVLTGDSGSSYRGARPTPEPATIALLGLGGLALLRKRR